MINLKKVRQEKGLFQQEMTKADGASLSAYHSYEQGKRDFNIAHFDIIVRTCLALVRKIEAIVTDLKLLDLLGRYRKMVDHMA